jgi:hypothetical protein
MPYWGNVFDRSYRQLHGNRFTIKRNHNPYRRGSARWWQWLQRWYYTVDISHQSLHVYIPKWADHREWRD